VGASVKVAERGKKVDRDEKVVTSRSLPCPTDSCWNPVIPVEYCTISIDSAVTRHRTSGYGQNPSLVPGHRGSGWCRKIIGQKSQKIK
jgi:hypothetical protein